MPVHIFENRQVTLLPPGAQGATPTLHQVPHAPAARVAYLSLLARFPSGATFWLRCQYTCVQDPVVCYTQALKSTPKRAPTPVLFVSGSRGTLELDLREDLGKQI